MRTLTNLLLSGAIGLSSLFGNAQEVKTLSNLERDKIVSFTDKFNQYLKYSEFSKDYNSIKQFIDRNKQLAEEFDCDSLYNYISRYEKYLDVINFFVASKPGIYKSKVFGTDKNIIVIIGNYKPQEGQHNDFYLMGYARGYSMNELIKFTNIILDKKEEKYFVSFSREFPYLNFKLDNTSYRYVSVFYDVGKNGKYTEKLLESITQELPSEVFRDY